jgi:polysaccharide pyruvyl transferase WcaK-like protein
VSILSSRLRDPVLVVGAYGYRNLGDEAILAGLLAKLGERAVTVVSRNPSETSRMHGVPSIGLGKTPAALRNHASVIIGGGGLFGRDMGRFGRLLPAYGLVAAGLGRTVVLEGVDIDEELALSGRILVPPLMRRAARVTVRDRHSAAIAAEWGVSAHVAPDLSSWMPMADPGVGRRLLQAAGLDLTKPVVGLALTAIQPGLVDAIVAAACGAMDDLPDVQFCFIPMSRHPFVAAHDDMRLAARIRSARPRLTILTGDPRPGEVLAAFAHLSGVVAMRYHAMLFAARTGVPLVPIAYAEKNVRWLGERGLRAELAAPAPVSAALRSALAGTPVAVSGARSWAS